MAAKLIECLWVSQYGAAAASGTVQFFQPGTLTQVNVYKNDAATQIATQPVALDANGRTVFPLYTTVPARAVITSSSGATLEDVERINGDRAALVALANTTWPNEASVDAALSAISTSLGGNDANFRSILTGAVDRPLRNKLADQTSVKDYGAKGDGVTDDVAAFNAGLAAIQATGLPGSLLMPAGNYIVSSPISITGAGTTLRGEGRAVSRITNTSGTGNAITISNVANVSLFDFGVLHSSTSTGSAISQTSTSAHYYRGLSLAGHRRGINGMSGIALDCDVTTDGSGTTGAAFYPAAAVDVDIIACRATTTTDRGFDGTNFPTNVRLIGSTWNNVTPGAIFWPGAGSGTTSVIVVGSRFYDTTGRPITEGNATGFAVYGNKGNGGTGLGTASSAAAGSWTQVAAGTTTLTMNIGLWQTHKLQCNSGGATVTFTFSGTASRDTPILVMFQNTSAGAVTWTAGANTITSTIVNPGAGLQITGVFMYDNVGGKLVQIGTWSTAITNT